MVRISARLRRLVVDAHGSDHAHAAQARDHDLREYWTLGKRDGRWTLLSIEQDAEGEHHLDAPLVAAPWGDDGGMRDEAVVEQAVGRRARPTAPTSPRSPTSTSPATPAPAARDLALVDQRFAPDVIEAAVAARARRPGPRRSTARTPRCSRSPRRTPSTSCSTAATRAAAPASSCAARAWRPCACCHVDGHGSPPTVAVAADIEGARYVEDRDTASVVRGDPRKRDRFTLRLDLALGDDPENPWKLVAPGQRRPRRLGSGGRPTEEDPMDDASVSDHIEALVAEEHRLLEHDPGTARAPRAPRGRPRRARPLLGPAAPAPRREEFGLDPDSTSMRDEDTVEDYEQ